MVFERKTIQRDAHFEGLGLHSGRPVRVVVRPGDRGLWFRLGAFQVRASPESVTGTDRCTRLGEVSTVEHLMSAFAGLEITDAEVEVDAPELPALDGSALPYVQGLRASGSQTVGRFVLEGPFHRVFVHSGDVRIAVSRGEGHWRYRLETPGRWPGDLVAEFPSLPGGYEAEISPARTWCFEEEIGKLRSAGLGLGLEIDSTVLIGKDGYANNARFCDEPARHKLLDLIGDLYLSGVPVVALNVSAIRSGHTAHVRAARLLSESVQIVTA